jgi:hypothetical protein
VNAIAGGTLAQGPLKVNTPVNKDTRYVEEKTFAGVSVPPPSFAEKIWNNKWTWAVGRTWRHHFANLSIFMVLITLASRKPPAAILDRIVANWTLWKQEIAGDVFALLVTLPGYLTSLYIIACLTIHGIIHATEKMGKVADY